MQPIAPSTYDAHKAREKDPQTPVLLTQTPQLLLLARGRAVAAARSRPSAPVSSGSRLLPPAPGYGPGSTRRGSDPRSRGPSAAPQS